MIGRSPDIRIERVFKSVLGVVIPLASFGCSGGETAPTAALHKVSGKVVLGRPGSLAGAKIHLVPDQPGSGARYATGELDKDGAFVIPAGDSGDGVAEGSYKVKLDPPPQNVGARTKPNSSILAPHLLDEDGSGIKVTVTASTSEIPPLKLSNYPPPRLAVGRDRD